MSEPLLNVMKIMLLAGLYLFFVRVLWSVFSELRDPRTVARKSGVADAGGRARGRNVAARPEQQSARPAPVGGAFAPAGVAVQARSVIGQLVVTEPAEHAGTTFRLGSEITIGRAETNGLVLDDTYVSTVHARIFETKGTYFIEDLASRNGSLLNGQAIVATTALVSGDQLQIGATLMEFS